MDFPFEYVERICDYPSFDHHQVSKQVQDKSVDPKSKECVISEEEELSGEAARADVVDEKEKALIEEIRRLESKRKSVKVPVSSGCSSSDSELWDSVGDTSDTDVIDGIFPNDDMRMKKFKIMRTCCCTDSECNSNTDQTISTSSSSTSTSSEDDVQVTEEQPTSIVKDKYVSSDETTSSSDDEMNIDDEIEYWEEVLQKMEKAEDKRRGKVPDDDSEEESDDDLDSMFDDTKSQTKTSTNSCEATAMEPTSVQQSPPLSSDSSTTSASSEIILTDSLIISSSDPDMDVNENDLEKFNWQSDDLYESSDTDSEIERGLNQLDQAMLAVESTFSNAAVLGENTQFMKEKLLHFQVTLPEILETKKRYEMMEEQDGQKAITDISKQLWLVQQLGSGCMHTAKLVNRKNPEHLQLQKNLDKERRLLYELAPELSKPSHIARLVDAGFDNDFKYLIYEDLGTDLLTLCEEFGPELNSATVFLITYFSFNAIKELQSFDVIHCDIRPSSFSILQHPFNVKITDYSRCIKKKPPMKTPDDVKPDSFTPRVFHRKDAEFDQFVDFEAWIYTMVYLFTSTRLPWFQDPENMLEMKEHLFNDPSDFVYDGCAEAVPMAATLIANNKMSYETFLENMNLVFSVDVMQYPDKCQPRLWSLKELEEIKKNGNLESDEENEMELIESHWNPADESVSEEESGDDEKSKNGKEETAKKSKMEKKKTSLKEDKTQQMSMSMSEVSNTEQWSEASSTNEKKSKPEKKNSRPQKRSPPKRGVADQWMMMEPTSTEQMSMPSNMPRRKVQNSDEPISKPEKPKKKEKAKTPPPVAVNIKEKKRPLVTREFLYAMHNDLNETDFSISSESSATSFSSWTSSSWTSDDDGDVKKVYKWSQKSDGQSDVDFFEDLNSEEVETHNKYEDLRALCYKERIYEKNNSDIEPLSDIDSEEKEALVNEIEKQIDPNKREEAQLKEKTQDEPVSGKSPN
ncbi:hypothetical protein B9Z55_010064 [Caenorhabditis nigoni]|uniref:Protein kinase domain-containing protein n=1 Tax=Caenorhabditis nigoni TaxID=1611254 RepID=A0A2G5UE88_9PELO|nr:hypothetical protein B9Z55_010064 [Caenorhabditis nigoni]